MDAMVRSTVDMATDTRRQGVMDAALQEFDHLVVTVPVKTRGGVELTATVTIQTPYRINYTSVDTAVGTKGYPSRHLPSPDADGAPSDLGGSVDRAKVGKGTPADMQTVIQAAVDQGKVRVPKLDDKLLGADGKLSEEGNAAVEAALKGWLTAGKGRLVGVDCSGFIYQIVTRMIATPGDPSPTWMHGLLDTGTGNLKSESALTTIESASTLRTGDLLLHGRHVEIVRSSTALSEPDVAALQDLRLPKGAHAWQLEVMESSPANNRQGPTSSTWLVVQTATELQWYKQHGEGWRRQIVTARRPDVLGEAPASDAEQAPGQKKGRKGR